MNDRYAALASHYAFEPLLCMPARGNEKPHGESWAISARKAPITRIARWPISMERLVEHYRGGTRQTRAP